MTDRAETLGSEQMRARLKRRRATERRFRALGTLAASFSVAMLFVLLGGIVGLAFEAFSKHELRLELEPPAQIASAGNDGAIELTDLSDFAELVREAMIAETGYQADTVSARLDLAGMFARLSVLPLANQMTGARTGPNGPRTYAVVLADHVDLYLKSGRRGERVVVWPKAVPIEDGGETDEPRTWRAETMFAPLRAALPAGPEGALSGPQAPSVLIEQAGRVWKVTALSDDHVQAVKLTGASKPSNTANAPRQFRIIDTPQAERVITDRQIALVHSLREAGLIRSRFNTELFAATDSTYPELAGALAALVGSLLTMFVTALLALPIGTMAALYLEEFAPNNRFTNLIEVNINNLAAVPSIVFGLLGAAVLMNVFGLPRSAPLLGGVVLALMTLPTVIIASRAALRSVPSSVRSGALAVGASPMQAVLHHVLPQAAPGMLTGAILGMARALGETAPLLLIGMVAFIAEVPRHLDEEATVLPVLVYQWATGAERAWEPMAAAAIIILLAFMLLMNTCAALLRQRFERRG